MEKGLGDVFARLEKAVVESYEQEKDQKLCAACHNAATHRSRTADNVWVLLCDDCSATDVKGNGEKAQKEKSDGSKERNGALASARPKVNFVHGEVTFHMVERTLRHPSVSAQSGEIFYDLGCGAGKALLAAAMLECFSKIRGIDLLPRSIEAGQRLLSLYCAEFDSKLASSTKKFTHPDVSQILLTVLAILESYLALKNVQLTLGDIELEDWADADIIYICSTCFEEGLMQSLARKCALLKAGTRVITMDKCLPAPSEDADNETAMATVEDKSSVEYQRITWEQLRKGINSLINKVNVANIKQLIPELFEVNLVRGRGLFARAIMKAQLSSPGFTHIYAALVAVVNAKMPENGELILTRVIMQFRRAYKCRDKVVAIAFARFIAHLVNQQVAHELLALQLLTLLLETPTDDSVEVAVHFTMECGQILQKLSPQGLHAIFERFRAVLHEGNIDKRAQYTIKDLFAIRKGGFAGYPAVHPELDLVKVDDQITFEIGLDDKLDKQELLDVFRENPKFEENDALWSSIKKEILGESDSDSDDLGESGDDEDDDNSVSEDEQVNIEDTTEQDMINKRRTIDSAPAPPTPASNRVDNRAAKREQTSKSAFHRRS